MPASTDVSREAFIAIANVLPALAFELTQAGSVTYLNDRWYESMAIAGDPLDEGWLDLVHIDDRARTLARLRTALASRGEYEDEFRLRVRDGSYRLFRLHARPARDADGGIVAWYGLASDIEDREAARRSLATSERELETFLQVVPQIVWTADPTGWIDWYNDRWFEYTGQSPEEAAGWGWQNAHHPEDFPRVMEAWPRSIDTGERFEMELRLRGVDGTFHWFLTRVEPLYDADGRIVRWYGSNTDIEEQKRTQERSAQTVRTLQQAVLPDRLPVHDRVRFDGVYRAAESEALVGGDWYDVAEVSDDRFVISCGDVAGHGVAASASVGRLRQSILFAALDGGTPAEILQRVNRILRRQEATIATCVVAIYDTRTYALAYALAGHPAPVVAVSRGRARKLPHADAPPLGVLDDLVTVTHELTLGPDAVIAFYSDGLTEFDRDLETAEVRLLGAVGGLVGLECRSAADTIRQTVMGEASSPDDVAILVVQCSTQTNVVVPGDGKSLVKRWRFHSSDARTAQASRRELMAFLSSLADTEGDLYAAELVVGEVLANTVEHAPGLVEIEIDWSAMRPELTARDRGPGMGAIVEREACVPLDPLAESGRGLFLISALSVDVRIESPSDGGTRIVATLPLLRSAHARPANVVAERDGYVARDVARDV
ncbi:MAG: hypothetical protein NVS2B8_18460 [Vulcanimicrobiaceae bacterium]